MVMKRTKSIFERRGRMGEVCRTLAIPIRLLLPLQLGLGYVGGREEGVEGGPWESAPLTQTPLVAVTVFCLSDVEDCFH